MVARSFRQIAADTRRLEVSEEGRAVRAVRAAHSVSLLQRRLVTHFLLIGTIAVVVVAAAVIG
jgi:hypothetical protein